MYKKLIVAYNCGTHIEAGGLDDQPDWWIDLLSWFIETYDDHKFFSRVNAILGDVKQKTIDNKNKISGQKR